MAIDSNGNLYAANSTMNSISKMDSKGKVSVHATGLSSPYGLAIAPEKAP
ncbi:MAG: hypothetical protein NT172_13590 [Planctomycetota bacterium]|nr:hypothetical protein [Planctomycetota bacterium]